MGRLKYGYLKCPQGFKEKMRRGHYPHMKIHSAPASAEDRKQEAMAEPKAAAKAKRTIKRAGFKRVVVELTDAHHEALERLAVADLRNGGATEMVTVLCRLNLDTLIKNHKPAQPTLPGAEKPYTINDPKE